MVSACTISSSVACPAVRYFSSLSYKQNDFRKKVLLNINCVFLFYQQLLSETFLVPRRVERDIYTYIYLSSCKVTVILVRIYRNLNLSTDFGKIHKYQIS